MKKFFIQCLALVILAFTALGFSTGKIPTLPFVPVAAKLSQLSINDNKLNIEIVNTADKRKKGLSERDKLDPDVGMLFKYDKPEYPQFWMKGVKFPLDIIWISNNEIIDIVHDAPINDSTVYSPPKPVDSVLEVNGGYAESHNIKVGDKITIK